jgi:hypothetical protein
VKIPSCVITPSIAGRLTDVVTGPDRDDRIVRWIMAGAVCAVLLLAGCGDDEG